MSYPISDIARIIGANSTIVNDYHIDHLLADSRKAYSPSTTLFFALKGLHRDGHRFINELYKKGVRNFVISEPVDASAIKDANLLRVVDTLGALQQLAAYHRSRFQIPVIGITGSNGKTIVKEWLYQLLQEKKTIVRSPKSFNSQLGVPLSVWQMNTHHNLAIFEAGISQPGEMEQLARIIQPTIGVLTNIGDAHNEGFRDRSEKLLEKIKLFGNAEVVICHSKDDPEQVLRKSAATSVIYCGDQQGDDIQVRSIDKETKTTSITIGLKENNTTKDLVFTIPFTDEASIENAILCFAVSRFVNGTFELDEIAARLGRLEPVEMRMQVKKGINNCTIINDSYSNDISSLSIALDYLKQLSGKQSSTLVLSDILQSGLPQSDLYKTVAAELKKMNVQRLLGIGEQISAHGELFKDAVPESTFYLSTNDFLEKAVSHQFRDQFILLKGARVFTFEKISKWLELKTHQTVLEINLNAIVHNLKEYQRILKPGTQVMAMVKAFAYGSGGAEIAAILQYHKIDYLGVAYADEGVELRKAGISLPVMVMNPEESSFDAILENNLEPEIYSFELLKSFDTFLKQGGIEEYPVHIEIETGMNRLGFSISEMKRLATTLRNSNCRVRSVFSHLAGSEEPSEDEFTLEQHSKFKKASGELETELGYSFLEHIANSAAIIRHKSLQEDMVRLGIGLYGVDNSGTNKLSLQPVATLRSTVAQLKDLDEGESVSYNRKSIVKRKSKIATVRIGYADGYPRRLGNGRGKVWVNGALAPVIGTVCMDMIMVDVTDLPTVREGDDVILFGAPLSVQQIALWAETIPYEIMTGVSQRVKRVYFEE